MKPRPKDCLKLLIQKVLIYLLTQKVSMTSKLWEIKATTTEKWVLDCWLGQQSACHASKKV